MTRQYHRITKEDVDYLIDFLTKTLQYNDEDDPYTEDEYEYLLALIKRLKFTKNVFEQIGF